jgi:hypothetical protein
MAVLLVTGCTNPTSGGPKAYQPPEGMGAVQLNFDKNIARATILPDDADITFFNEFVLEFTAAGGGAVTIPSITRSQATKDNPVDLVPGQYNLLVIAYLTTAAAIPSTAAAVWSSDITPLNITPGNTTSQTITLKPYDPDDPVATEPGTFAWEIDNKITGKITSAKMTVKDLTGTTVVETWNPVIFNVMDPTWVGMGSIFSGYYYVDIELIVSGVQKNFRHVLHIYQNFTSTFKYEFTDNHIGVVEASCTPKIIYVHPEDNPPVLSVAKVTSLNILQGTGAAATPYLLSLSDLTLPSDLTITVDNAGTFTGGIEYFNGTASLALLVGVGGDTLEIDSSVAPFDTVGTYQVLVVGTIGTTNGIPYEKEIFIKVVEDEPKLTAEDSTGIYNPDGLKITNITGSAGTITITLSGTVNSGFSALHPDIAASFDPNDFDPSNTDSYTVVTLTGLYDAASVSPTNQITRKLSNQSINLYDTMPASVGGGWGTSGVYTETTRASAAPDFCILLWNGVPAADRIATLEVTIGTGPTITYIIDWTGLTIN